MEAFLAGQEPATEAQLSQWLSSAPRDAAGIGLAARVGQRLGEDRTQASLALLCDMPIYLAHNAMLIGDPGLDAQVLAALNTLVASKEAVKASAKEVVLRYLLRVLGEGEVEARAPLLAAACEFASRISQTQASTDFLVRHGLFPALVRILSAVHDRIADLLAVLAEGGGEGAGAARGPGGGSQSAPGSAQGDARGRSPDSAELADPSVAGASGAARAAGAAGSAGSPGPAGSPAAEPAAEPVPEPEAGAAPASPATPSRPRPAIDAVSPSPDRLAAFRAALDRDEALFALFEKVCAALYAPLVVSRSARTAALSSGALRLLVETGTDFVSALQVCSTPAAIEAWNNRIGGAIAVLVVACFYPKSCAAIYAAGGVDLCGLVLLIFCGPAERCNVSYELCTLAATLDSALASASKRAAAEIAERHFRPVLACAELCADPPSVAAYRSLIAVLAEALNSCRGFRGRGVEGLLRAAARGRRGPGEEGDKGTAGGEAVAVADTTAEAAGAAAGAAPETAPGTPPEAAAGQAAPAGAAPGANADLLGPEDLPIDVLVSRLISSLRPHRDDPESASMVALCLESICSAPRSADFLRQIVMQLGGIDLLISMAENLEAAQARATACEALAQVLRSKNYPKNALLKDIPGLCKRLVAVKTEADARAKDKRDPDWYQWNELSTQARACLEAMGDPAGRNPMKYVGYTMVAAGVILALGGLVRYFLLPASWFTKGHFDE